MLKPLLFSIALLASSGAFAQEATSTPPVQEQAAAASESEAAPAPEAAPAVTASPTAGATDAPPEGKGQIVFFREKKFGGSAIRFKVREGHTELGKLSSGTYFVLPVEAGAHEYTVHSEAKDVLNIEVEAGETYYVVGTITMGILAGRPNLSPSDQATFDGMKAKLKLAAALD